MNSALKQFVKPGSVLILASAIMGVVRREGNEIIVDSHEIKNGVRVATEERHSLDDVFLLQADSFDSLETYANASSTSLPRSFLSGRFFVA